MNKASLTTGLRRRRKGGAFTLVEVLAATLVFAIVMVLLVGVVNTTTLITSGTNARIDSVRVARESLNLMGRDLMEVTLPYPRTNTNSLQFVVNPAGQEGYNNHDVMLWQAPLLRESADHAKGNLVVVGYFVLRDLQPNGQNSRFQLRRVYSSPTDTDYKLYPTPPNDWIPPLSAYGPATAAADDLAGQKGWVADGVLGMWIQCLDGGGYLLPNSATFSSRAPVFGLPNAMGQSYPATYPYTRLPAFVQVTLVCIGAQEIPRVKNLPTTAESETAAGFLAAFRAANAGVKSAISFSRTFRLPSSD